MQGVKYATEEERTAARKRTLLAYYYRNKDLVKKKTKDRRMELRTNRLQTLKKHGLDESSYQQLLNSQGGVCAICSGPPIVHSVYHVDHDHRTGKVRGLLCQSCNTGIGKLKDDPVLLQKAFDYLVLHGQA